MLSSRRPPRPATATPPQPEPDKAPAKPSRPHGRRALPKNLRRVPRVYELTEAERRCPECGECRIQIGAERSEQLDYEPATLFVVEHVRCTYACPHCEGQVVTAGKPAQPIKKGLPGPGLLAHVITEKYCDHLPLHRQERRLARQGVELSRSTLCDWMAGAARMLEPLHELMKTLILCAARFTPTTRSVKVRDSERKIKATGSALDLLRRPPAPYNVFDFTMSRKRDGPSRFLAGFRGHLQADAFSGYDGIYAGGDVVEVGCNATRAAEVHRGADDGCGPIGRGAGLLPTSSTRSRREIKAEIAKLPPDSRGTGTRRDPAAGPSRTGGPGAGWLQGVAGRAEAGRASQEPDWAPRSVTCRTNWEALRRYTSSGYLSIDNNVAEQHMKTIATGRKNWLFTGSENGGKTMAVLFSVVSSCQRHGHDPFVYLRDVLERLPSLPHDRLAELLPDRWSPPKPAEASSPESAAGNVR